MTEGDRYYNFLVLCFLVNVYILFQLCDVPDIKMLKWSYQKNDLHVCHGSQRFILTFAEANSKLSPLMLVRSWLSCCLNWDLNLLCLVVITH